MNEEKVLLIPLLDLAKINLTTMLKVNGFNLNEPIECNEIVLHDVSNDINCVQYYQEQ